MKKNSDELTIVTAFFDIGRSNMNEYARSNNKYLDYFKFWARIENNIIVYTDKFMAEKVKEVRKEYGLLDKTKIEIIDDYLTIEPKLYERMEEVSKNQTFLTFRYTDNPMDNNAKYDYVMLLKAWCLQDAVKKGYAKGMLAWLDFGYNHGGELYTKPEEFAFLWKVTDIPNDKITMFSVKKDDNKPIFQVVQSYDVYVMGFNIIMPASLAECFWEDIKEAMNSLINVGFIDDDQTLLLMISRMYKERYNLILSDWFMPLKEHGGKHLTIKNKSPEELSLKTKVITRLRIIKRNYKCSKRLKSIFYKNTIE